MAEDNNQSDQNQNNIQSSFEQLQNDLNSAIDGWKRTAADFENYKRRKEAENKELVEFAKEVTVAKLLPIIDSLEQALKHVPQILNQSEANQNLSDYLLKYSPELGEFGKKYDQWQKGIVGIVMQLDKALEELGVKKIESVGKKFDPNFHEAVREVESESPDGMIVDELQTGFELNGKVIRPSQVTISKSKS